MERTAPEEHRRVTIGQGAALAELVRKAGSKEELESLEPKIRQYENLLDEHFGVPGNTGEGKDSSAAASLWVAYNWRKDALETGHPETTRLANQFLNEFLAELEQPPDWHL